MSGTHGTLNAYLLTRSKWSHQQRCKVKVRPCIIPHHTVEETESWTVHATYSREDPTDDPQPVHTLNEGWHSQSCMSWPLPTVPDFSPAVRHVILFSLVKHVTLHLYTDRIHVGQMFFVCGCPFVHFVLSVWQVLLLFTLQSSLEASPREPSMHSTSLLWSSSPGSVHLSSHLQCVMVIVYWSFPDWNVSSSGVGDGAHWG